MTDKEKYQKIVQFTKKHGEYEDYHGNKHYQIDEIAYPLGLYYESGKLGVCYQKPGFYGDDGMAVTPDNMDEFIKLAKVELNLAKEFVQLIEEIE